MISLFNNFGADLLSLVILYPCSFVLSILLYGLGFFVSRHRFPHQRSYSFELYGGKCWAIPGVFLIPFVSYIGILYFHPLTRVTYFLVGYILLPIWMTCLIQLMKVPEQRFYFLKIPMWMIFLFYVIFSVVLWMVISYCQAKKIDSHGWEFQIEWMMIGLYLLIGSISLFTGKPEHWKPRQDESLEPETTAQQ